MKKIYALIPISLLAACNDIDISKYPKDIQNCYNKIIYNSNNCTKNNKIVLKYCQCFESRIQEVKQQVYRNASNANAFDVGFGNFMTVLGNAAIEKQTEVISKDCSESTNFIPIAECKNRTQKGK